MKIPVSTYRLQVNADFPFRAVRSLIEYFRDLGVSTLYFSPVFKARPRSPHGYDVTDPSKFSRDAGDEAEFALLSAEANAAGMNILLDIVPNHMAAAEDNPLWHDLLEHGTATLAANFFDIEWNARGSGNRLILPILGQELSECVRKGEIKLELRDDVIRAVYFARSLPLDPRTWAQIFENIQARGKGSVTKTAAQLADAARAVIPREQCGIEQRAHRKQAAQTLKNMLREQLQQAPELRTAIGAALNYFNQPDQLLQILEAQPYRLEFWRSGTRRLNYRRFFDISDLAGVRVEDRDVFEVTHTLTLELILAGRIEGVRIDQVEQHRNRQGKTTDNIQKIGCHRVAWGIACRGSAQHVAPPLQAHLAWQRRRDAVAYLDDFGIEGIEREQRAAIAVRREQRRQEAILVGLAYPRFAELKRLLHGRLARYGTLNRRRSEPPRRAGVQPASRCRCGPPPRSSSYQRSDAIPESAAAGRPA